MPIVRIYLKSGIELEVSVESFTVNKSRGRLSSVEWGRINGIFPDLLHIDSDEIAAVIDLGTEYTIAAALENAADNHQCYDEAGHPR